MRITRSKTPVIRDYYLNIEKLKVVAETPYRGIQLQNDLKWNRHVHYVSGKASRTLGMIKRNLRMNNTKLKTTAYKTLVRPAMEYGATAWDPYTKKNINKLEEVQKIAARYILRNYDRKPGTVTRLLDQLQLESLADRSKQLRLNLLFKIVNNLVDIFQFLFLLISLSDYQVNTNVL